MKMKLFFAALLIAVPAHATVLTLTDDASTQPLLDVKGLNAAPNLAAAVPGHLVNINDGSAAAPVSVDKPSVTITRYESGIADFGGNNAALQVNSTANASANPTQNVAIQTTAVQYGKGDTVGFFTYALNYSTQGNTAYGGFFDAQAIGSPSGAVGLEVVVENKTGSAIPYGAYTPGDARNFGVSIVSGSGVQPQNSAGINMRWNGAAFDMGMVLGPSVVTTNSIYDRSSSQKILYADGAHARGIDLTGGTYSQYAFASPGFSVNGTGQISITGGTPATSSAACTAGAIQWNASYIYVCVATNTWKRTALATW